jgi:ATP-dependent DNA helicase RecQ
MPLADIFFMDLEVRIHTHVIDRVGALLNDVHYNGTSVSEIRELYFAHKPPYICGHNFINHDKKFLLETTFNPIFQTAKIIDTFYLSMLLYPDTLTHKLSKPYKTEAHIQNDPFGDCVATRELLERMMERFGSLDPVVQSLLSELLKKDPYYEAFFTYLRLEPPTVTLYDFFKPHVLCSHETFETLLAQSPTEMGIIMVYLMGRDRTSLSYAVLQTFPKIVTLLKALLYDPSLLNLSQFAQDEFNLKGFREFDARDKGDDLFSQALPKISQKIIIESALNGESLLAILPTGGGKTFTFQMPALITARAYKALTVVISPLQALMKNHVESFREKNHNFKVAAISGYLSPIERLNAIAEVENGIIDIVYIAPEALRSNSIFSAFKKRIIARFVIDEAHCFSSWGHDFRHDYNYIATFIRDLQTQSPFQGTIPVSCLTATAKPKVIEDIKHYFLDKLNLTLVDHIASTQRNNLHYKALEVADEKEKYEMLIKEIQRIGKKAMIIYIPHNARRCQELSQKLKDDPRMGAIGLEIEPFYAKIDTEIENGKRQGRNKSEILNDFIADKIDIVVATTAFGMGIDKPNIEAVIHYETSDSLESYLQESGRGGRSEAIDAECILLYAPKDFDKLFIQQNRSKIEYAEITRILREIKNEKRNPTILSLKQIAHKAGIDTEDSAHDYEGMIKTALLELENVGILERGRNTTKIYATSLQKGENTSGMEYVRDVLDPHKERLGALYEEMIRVMATLIGRSKLEPIEVDDLSDYTGIQRNEIHTILYELAQYELIAMENDISVYMTKKVLQELEKHFELETKILTFLGSLPPYQKGFHLRDLNDSLGATINHIPLSKKILQSFTHLARLAKKNFNLKFHKDHCYIVDDFSQSDMEAVVKSRQKIARGIITTLLHKHDETHNEVEFSSTQLKKTINEMHKTLSIQGFHHTLVYMHDTLKEFKLRKGRLIYYQGVSLRKKERIQEKKPYQKLRDYNQSLALYYERKTEAIHILMEFFKKLLQEGWDKCVAFIRDYFSMEYKAFKKRYQFSETAIKRPMTQERYEEIIRNLNDEQTKIFEDKTNPAVMVLAGPGSGKTKTLVHKIASLITLEHQKPDHFLMLTHGRAAAHEFRTRLEKLIGNLAYEVEIMTFHAYALQLIGRSGATSLHEAIDHATKGLESGMIELPFKTMLVLDEYQDVGAKTYRFITAIFNHMESGKRIIAVGDDDQCINNFGGEYQAEVAFMSKFETDFGHRVDDSEEEEHLGNVACYWLLTNYRSNHNLVTFANTFAQTIPNRLKQEDLIAHHSKEGRIEIHHYPRDSSMMIHLVTTIENDPSEDIAILCRTNDAVLTLYSLLKAAGINVKYLTSKEGFGLGQLVELQEFLSQWKASSFDEAKIWLEKNYKISPHYPLACSMIEFFDSTTGNEWANVFEIFLQEIEFDEFPTTKAKVTISTMHKAKGKEFQHVYMMVENTFIRNDYDRRLLYVAMTRAKENLFIHTQDRCFDSMEPLANAVLSVTQKDTPPTTILFAMRLEDVSLGSEAAAQGVVATSPKAGETVQIEKKTNKDGTVWFKLTKERKTIGVLSAPKGGQTRLSDKICQKETQGYTLYPEATIEYVVRWEDKEKNQTYDQVLCLVRMDKDPLKTVLSQPSV